MKKLGLLIFVCLITVVTATAEPFVVRHLGMEKGLSSNFVLHIAQDKNGTLWFATEEGLNRFDGSRFYTYYKRDGKNSISANELNCLLDDPQAPILWIGTQRDGLNAFDYDKQRFTCYKHNRHDKHSLVTNDITGVAPSADGSIWVSTYWQGVDHFDRKTERFTHYNRKTVKGLKSNQTWTALDGGDGSLYVGHVNAGLSIIDVRTRVARNFMHDAQNPYSISDNEVNCLYRDKRGTLWVGTGRGLDIFDQLNGRFVHVNPTEISGHRISCIKELSDGRLWVGTEQGGLAILSIGQGLLTSSGVFPSFFLREGDTATSLSGNSVRTVFEDQFHNVWIGTYGGGVSFYSYVLPPFRQLSYAPVDQLHHLSNKTALSVCYDAGGNLWVGTDGAGVEVYNRRFERIASYPLSVGTSVQAAFRDSRGELWFGSFYQGATVFASDGGFHAVKGLPHNEDVRGFYEDNHHDMCIATSTGIYICDLTTHAVRHHIRLTHNLVRAVAQDSKGNYWVGTFGGGLTVYTPSWHALRTFDVRRGFPSNTINQIYRGHDGSMWVASGEGLVCFARGSLKKYTVKDWKSGLVNVYIRAIAEDQTGHIWFSTNKGISCLDRETGRVSNYGLRDNVPVGNFNSACVAQHGGVISFGSTGGGLTSFDPRNVLASCEAPQPFITDIIFYRDHDVNADSTLYLAGADEIELTYKENTFRVNFNVQNYALADAVEYSFRLEGQHDEWATIDGNSIMLRNLPAGDYTLQVRTRLHNQPWNTRITSLDIAVRPPFWLSWWAKLIYVLLALAAIMTAIYIYQRHLRLEYLYRSEKQQHEKEQELNTERMQFFTNITHELRTPLTLIIGPLEDLSRSSQLSEGMKHQLATIHQSAQRLNSLIRQLLEFRKVDTESRRLCVERGNLVDIVHEVELKYEELNRNSRLAIRFASSDPEIETYYDKEVITIIVDNLLSNAIKYTDEGSVDISVNRSRHDTRHLVNIVVADTGYGISEKALPHIFERFYQERGPHQASGTGVGLAIVRQLVTLHQGTIAVESSVEKGTTFTVTLDVDNVYPDALRATGRTPTVDTLADTASAGTEETQDKPILLIVEDNKDIRNYVAESFADEYEVRQAEDGQKGLALALDCSPNVIVSDIMMPRMDGIELCKRLKADVRTSHIPVILLTAKDSMTAKEEGYDAGADSYLTKPFSRSLLASRINNLMLQRRRQLAGQGASATALPDMEAKRRQLREAMNKTDQEFFDKLNTLIEKRISGDIDVNYLAQNLALSTSTLYRKMKALTGESTNEYVRHYKMQYAEHLLLEGKYTVGEIAFMVGMNSVAYFRRCFRETFGMLPSEYVKNLKEQ
jgi:signal transduction histidine kinase/ligand-binding sensor domain-containing protein/DNA-binding response OmpR family regulator